MIAHDGRPSSASTVSAGARRPDRTRRRFTGELQAGPLLAAKRPCGAGGTDYACLQVTGPGMALSDAIPKVGHDSRTARRRSDHGCGRRLGPGCPCRPRALRRRRAGDELRRIARRAVRQLRAVHLRARPRRSGRGVPLHHQPVSGSADGVLGDHLPALRGAAGRRQVRQPAGIVGPVARRAADAVHRTRLADRSADRRRGPERRRRRLPVRHGCHRTNPYRHRRQPWPSRRKTQSTPPATS